MAAKVITVMNMKGGVGKTTVTMHLAGILVQNNLGDAKSKRVLAIDYDPQFNLSQAYIPPSRYFALEKAGKTTLSILTDDVRHLDPYKINVPGNHTPPKVADITFPAIAKNHYGGNLDVVPSTLDLMYVALGQANVQIKPIEERFEKFIDEARSLYDIVLIDCHPAGSVFTRTSLRNSDHVLIPVAPQRYAVRGIGLMMEFISAKKLGGSGPAPHILFNATPRVGTAPEEAAIRGDPDYAPYCMKSTLKRYKAFSDPEGGKGFVWYSGAPYSTEAYINLAGVGREFLARIA
jgi:chromosome partitioning protein